MKNYYIFFRYRLLCTLLLVLFSSLGWGQSIFSNPITGTNPSTANPYTIGQTVDSNLSVSGIGRGTGNTGSNANDRYSATGWSTTTLDADDYFDFVLTPNAGYKINFTSFVYTGQRSGTGPNSFAFRSSIDSFTTDIGSASATGATISLSGTAYQDVSSAITFRIYAWNSNADGGTYSINDFTFNGTVVPTGPAHHVVFDKNDAAASGTMANQLIAENATANLSANTFSKSGYNFSGWSTTSSGAVNYTDQAPFTMGNSDVTLYAQWVVKTGPCHLENFNSLGNSGSYSNVTWSGDGGEWTATDAREDQIINGKAITFRNGKVTTPQFTDGIGALTLTTKYPFSDGSGTIDLYVNNAKVGSFNVSTTAQTQTLSNINIPGNVILEFRNTSTSKRPALDDISWTCYSGSSTPNINIQGNAATIVDGDVTPSTADGTDFGAAIIAGANVEKTFTIQNLGGASLTLDNPAVVLLDGSKGFSVSAQPTVNPMTGYSNQTFKINFSNLTPGTYTETVMIGSDDPDTPVYTFDVKAVITSPSITSDQSALSGFSYPFAQGPSSPLQDFTVNGTSLASDISVVASANWEISTNQTYDGGNASPWQNITLATTLGGQVNNKKIYVRLKDGLAAGNYTGIITLSSASATSVVINLSGAVTAGVADIKLTGNGTSIANGSTSPMGLNNTLFAAQNIGNSQTKSFVIKNEGGANLTINAISISGADASSFTTLSVPAVGTVLNTNQTASFDIKFAPTSIGTKTATVSISNTDANDNPYTFVIQGGAKYCAASGEIIIARQDFEATPATPSLGYTVSNIGIPGSATGFSSGKSSGSDDPKDNNLYSETARGYRVQGSDPSGIIPSGLIFNFDNVDTSIYSDISMSFKVAGFSLGSSSNGIDCNNSTSGENCVDDHLKADYVLVEISPDGGVTWYQQAKVVSDEMNLAWSFGSNGTTSGTRTYAADNNLTYFKSTKFARYSAISISGLPTVSQLKLRITAQDNAQNESWILDDIRITSTGLVPKVWDGSQWLPSAPTPSDKVVINGNYNSKTNGAFTACQCEIKSGVTLTVDENTVQVTDFLDNKGSLVLESDANFVQRVETDANIGGGNFIAKRKINLTTDRKQYNYLISPAVGMNMKNIYKDSSGNPVAVPFVLYHNEVKNWFYNSDGSYIPGRALAVKEPAEAFLPTEMQAEFHGQPKNGSFSYALVNSDVSNPNRGFNLIGNPYPSNIDLVKLYQNNSSAEILSPTFYFWDNTVNSRTAQEGDNYGGQAYAEFNAATPPGIGTGKKATGDNGFSPLKIPTRYVSVGQGFMTKVENASGFNLAFSNSIREAQPSVGFFGKAAQQPEIQVNRYWLKLTSPKNISSSMAVVYFDEGKDEFTIEDSRSMGGSDAIYSLVDEVEVSINGKATFDDADVVTLGAAYFEAGNYSIAIDRAEGIFTGVQPIYLKDHLNNSITDLSQTPYVFSATAGIDTHRFELVYKTNATLGGEEVVKRGLEIYREAQDFVLRSTETITQVEVFDLSGRLTQTLKTQAKELRLPAETWLNGVYILKVQTSSGVQTKRVMK